MVDCKTFEEFQSKLVYLYEKYTLLFKITHEAFTISGPEMPQVSILFVK